MSKKRNKKNRHKARQNRPLAPSPTPVQAAPSTNTTSPKPSTPTAKSKIPYIVVTILVTLLLVTFAIVWFNPIFAKSRQWKRDIGNKMPGFYVSPYWDQSENVIRISHNGEIIGTTVSTEPTWISEGIELAKNGQNDEKALFAARYATECKFVENDFDYLYVVQGEEFNRDQHWRYCVWTLGEAYFNRPETMSDEVYEFIRAILIDLLR